MAELATPGFCAVHPGRTSLAACDRCRKPICSECVIAGPGDSAFCSKSCAMEADPAVRSRFLEGLEHPYRVGYRLWLKSIPDLFRYSVPLVFLGILTLYGSPRLDPVLSAVGDVLFYFLLFYIPLTAEVVLARRYTGWIPGHPYLIGLRRFLYVAVTWILVYVTTVLGSLLFIVPGIILGARLVWADELVVSHSMTPLQATRKSWALGEGRMKSIVLFQILLGIVGSLLGMILGFLAAIGLMIAQSTPAWAVPIHVSAIAILFLLGLSLVRAIEIAKFHGFLADEEFSEDRDAE